MTDTGQVPGEGLPENAGMVEQPGVSASGAYAYLSETTAEDEDLLLPGSHGAWGNEVAPPAPEPVVEAVHEPGPHELSGRDSGSVDLGGVRLPDPAPAPAPIPPVTPRRPLHLGPPMPDTSASPVRSLADRGPAGAPVRQTGPQPTGPEYLDVPHPREAAPQGAAPWGAQAAAQAPVSAGAAPAETVVPAHAPTPEPVGAAQAVVARVATEAVAATGGQPTEAGQGAPAAQAVPAAPVAPAAHAAPDVQVAQAEQAAPAGQVAAADQAAPAAQGQDDGYAAQAAEASGEESGTTPAADPGQDPAGAPGEAAGQGPAGAAAEAADQGGADAPVAEAGQGIDGASVQGAEQGPVAASVSDAGQASETAHSPESPATPEQAQLPQDAQVSEDVQVSQGSAPDAAEAPGPVGPEAVVPTAEAAGPDTVAQAAEAVGPEAAAPTSDDEIAAETAQAPEAAGEPVPAEATAGDAAPAPEPVGAPVPAAEPSAPEPVAPAPESTEATATPVPAAPDAAQVPQPAEGSPAPAEDLSAVATEPPLQQADAEAAVQDRSAAPAPQAQPVQDPQPVQAPQHVQGPQQAHAPQATQEEQLGQDPQAPQQAQPEPGGADAQEVAAAPAASAAPATDEAGPAAHPAPALTPDAPQPPDLTAGTPDATAQPADSTPPAEPAMPPAADTAPAPAPEAPAEHGTGDEATAPLPGGLEPHSDQPVGQFVPVAGSVPTTPHLAPTPSQGLTLPTQEQQTPEAVATVPGQREAASDTETDADPELAQSADDLDTRGAGQEDQHDPENRENHENHENHEDHEDHEEESDEESAAAAVAEVRQPTRPAAPGYDDAEREAVLKVMRERRDIRNGFRSDPIPHDVLLRVLEAAHTAPSVGHSQPWDFVVIRSAETRRTMHELAMRQREAYAKSLPKGRAKQFKELKIEAILDTPVNIVVTADPTRGGRHTLGRHTQPQMAPYSAALAVENLWLAARAEGLGVGWVSFFDEREMVRALGLPEHLEVIAYLCVGYVDEFPDEPELMQAGWSKRRPLSWVVHEETYGRRALPGEEPHDLLAETVAQIRPLDAKALGEAWERQKRMTKPAGALGMLEIISAQLSGLSRQCPPPIPEPAAVAIFAGDHGVHAQGVTPWPQEVTAQMVANFLGGGAVCNAFAGQVGAEVCVVDVGVAADLPATPGLLPRKVRAGTSDMTTGTAMSREEAKKAIEVGIETARDLVAAGNKALLTGEMGIANTTASAALISVFTGADPAEVTGRGTGINDETLARKTEVVRRAIELHQPDPADPIGVLAAIGGFEHAAMVGLLLGGASLRTPVILDGVSAGAAALVARAIAPEVLAACIAGHRSAEPGHVAALNKLGLRPLVDLDLRLGEGTGALLALPLVQSTARAMHEVATFDSAGVTEK